MKNKTVWLVLLSCVVCAFLHLLLFYYLMGGNPAHRVNYALFISLTPALLALVLARLKKTAWTNWRTAEIYFLLFLATVIVQAYGRMIPVYQIAQNLKP